MSKETEGLLDKELREDNWDENLHEACICCQAEDGWYQLGLCQDCFDECKEEAEAHNCTVESYWKIKPKEAGL